MVERLNTATGALGVLRHLQAASPEPANLQSSRRDLAGAQARPASDPKVSRPGDGPAVLRTTSLAAGQGPQLNAVALSLSRAESISDTALSAAGQISAQLLALKSTAAQAMGEELGPDQRQALQATYDDQMQTLARLIRNASFDEANLLDGSRLAGGVAFIADAEGTQQLRLSGRDFTPGGPVIIASPDAGGLASPAAAEDVHARLERSIANVGAQLSDMTQERRRIEAQKGFLGRLADALAQGAGVGAAPDLAVEGALIQALQIRQQLSTQPVGIANTAPQLLLQIFRS